MQLLKLLFILLLLISSITISEAKTVTVSDCDGSSDQEQINEALKYAAENPGTTVDLGSLTYIIDGTIWIYPNTVLMGAGAEVCVDSSSSWWFREGIPVIGCPATYNKKSIIPHDIEVYGFTVDGNCGAFDPSWANDGKGKGHNCMKLIIFAGSSNNFGYNIFIHDMELIHAFSDGAYFRFINNVHCYNNKIINTQHEGIYYSCVTNGSIYGNEIAGITSDCARLDNCADCKVYGNLFFSYNGDTNTYKNGENGLQIADAGSSNGYNAAKPQFKTKNIEVYDNTFSDPGLKAIWLHGGENVYVHDNRFIDADELETDGTPVNIAENGEPISYDNPPTKEQSEAVFDSIFDILTMDFLEFAGNSTAIYSGGEHVNSPTEATGTITQYIQGNNVTTFVDVPKEGLTSIHYEFGGMETVHTLMLGERHGLYTVYSNVSIWKGDLSRSGDSLCLEGDIDPSEITVTCYTTRGSFNPVLDTQIVKTENGRLFNPLVIVYLLIILILLCVPVAVLWILTSWH